MSRYVACTYDWDIACSIAHVDDQSELQENLNGHLEDSDIFMEPRWNTYGYVARRMCNESGWSAREGEIGCLFENIFHCEKTVLSVLVHS